MERENLQAPMTAIQKVLGWIYLPVHIFGLPLLIPSIVLVLSGFGVSLTYTQVNFVYYFVSFIFLGILMMGYLRESFFDMCDRVLQPEMHICFPGVLLRSCILRQFCAGFFSYRSC